jgi:hypothetical protein
MFEAFRDPDLDMVEAQTSVWLSEQETEYLNAQINRFLQVSIYNSFEISASHSDGRELFRVQLYVGARSPEQGRYLVHIEVDCEIFDLQNQQPSQQTSNLDAMKEVLTLLSAFTQGSRLQCKGRWFFDWDDWEPIVSLPILKMNIPGTPYRQISGFRLSVDDTKGPDYAIFDMETEEYFSVIIGFTTEGSMSVSLFNDIAARVQPLKDGIVAPASAQEEPLDDLDGNP